MPRFKKGHSAGMTTRQKDILDFIVQHHAAFKICPTTREIQQRFGFASQNAAISHVKALMRNGAPISKTASGRLVYHDPVESIPWPDVYPLIDQMRFAMRPKHEVLNEFFAKYPHLKECTPQTQPK